MEYWGEGCSQGYTRTRIAKAELLWSHMLDLGKVIREH